MRLTNAYVVRELCASPAGWVAASTQPRRFVTCCIHLAGTLGSCDRSEPGAAKGGHPLQPERWREGVHHERRRARVRLQRPGRGR